MVCVCVGGGEGVEGEESVIRLCLKAEKSHTRAKGRALLIKSL